MFQLFVLLLIELSVLFSFSVLISMWVVETKSLSFDLLIAVFLNYVLSVMFVFD